MASTKSVLRTLGYRVCFRSQFAAQKSIGQAFFSPCVGAITEPAILPKYWGVPRRQIETSVVLGDQRWFDALLATWVRRYFPADQVQEAIAVLAPYGDMEWHREPSRVKRDAVIVSRGNLDALKAAIQLADRDYRDVLIGEEVDSWVIGELKKYGK